MDKKSRNILIIFGVALLGIIITELVRPKPINWNSSYTSTDKIPFGSYILYEELKDWNDNKKVQLVSKNPYEFLKDSSYATNSAYLLINSEIDLDKQSYTQLIQFVREGNDVFLAGTYFGNIIKDSLKIETEMSYKLTEEEITPAFFSSSSYRDSIPKYKKGIYKTIFRSFDTTKTKALGYYKNEEEKISQVNFIKVKEGEGHIYFNTLPEAFSNYYMLKNQGTYTANVLSYINDRTTLYWDDYLKDGRRVVNSPMRFVLNQPALQWAYYICLLSLLVFVIFRGKREQRIIPVIKPLENTSIEFTKTISNLYFQHKDYGNIINKKITYFLEKVRRQYYINTNELNAKFIDTLAIKSGHSLEETKKLIEFIVILKGRTMHNEKDLIELNKKIEAFTL
ncbi:DUF4350 domain-containing protein [Aquimarina pacifica]|uniref:DUF4350 domain-containing protein n=1 Tax=Aquimarina pacifica TaxID=1296415 RepID=UPI00046EB241|nr:DUF4350 domain-containing protein [Aquimarina pacifica]